MRSITITRKIFALITAQESCKRIIKIAREQARLLSSEVEVITVQPLKAEAKIRSRDMICLTKIAKETDSEIRIIYSDNPLNAIISEAEKNNPCHIFVGQGGEHSCFINRLRLSIPVPPISVVGIEGVIYSIPPIIDNYLALG